MTDPRDAVLESPYGTRTTDREGLLLLDRNEGGAGAGSGGGRPDTWRRYPDLRAFTSALSQRLGLHANQLLITAGADDGIDRTCRAFLGPGRRLLVGSPTFEMLERYTLLAHGGVDRVPWTTDPFPRHEFLRAIGPDTGVVAIVSPNNPTGLTASRADIEEIATAAGGAMVLVDHAYVEYADEDLTALAIERDNVIVVRTFSKAWGLAGCRVGFAVSQPHTVRTLRAAGAPYPVSTVAAGVVADRMRRESGAVRRHVQRVRRERSQLTDRLKGHGFVVWPSQANFVLADLGARAEWVLSGLRSLGVIVRDFTQKAELGRALRISLPGGETEFDRLCGALDTVSQPEGLLFDLDGVIADVTDSYRACIGQTARSFAVSVTPDDVTEAKAGGDANNDWILTQRLMEERGRPIALERIKRRFQSLYHGTTGEPGLRERERLLVGRDVLSGLAARCTLGIVTGRPRREAEWFLSRHGIRDLFGTVVSLEDARSKPDPEPVRLALQRLGVSRAWMVGDTPDDIVAAREGGVMPLGFVAPSDRSARAVRALEDSGAARVLSHMNQLTEYLP